MREYHKINAVWKRDENGNLLEGQYSLPEFMYLAENEWLFTEKVDGTNIRVMWDSETVRFGGKTDNAQIPAPLIARLQDLFPVEHFEALPFPTCLYGEGYGAKIQKGGGNYKPDGVDFVLFDVWIDGWWLKRGDVLDIAEKLNIDTVPIIGSGTLQNAIDIVKEGFDSRWGGFRAEGLVMRPLVELFARNGERIIAKIKMKDFK